MCSKQFRYIFFIQCIIFHCEYNFVMALFGPNIRRVTRNEFSGVVAILATEGPLPPQLELQQKCTATLITKQDVLTAEHCLRTTLRQGFRVLVGSVNLGRSVTFYPLFIFTYDHWAIFMQRHEITENDIALIKLIGNVEDNVQVMALGNVANNVLYGLNAQIAGWGRLTNGTKPRILHTGTVRILPKLECELRYYNLSRAFTIVNERRLCTIGDPPVVVNHGDSGGPLIYFGALIGISTGAMPGFPDNIIREFQMNMHTVIRPYHEYINDVINRFYVNF